MNYELQITNKKNKGLARTAKQGGFTLVEMLVAMTIFLIVMVVAIGALFVAHNSAQKAKALRVAMDNVNFAMENMSRSLRLGSNYFCTKTQDVSSNLLTASTQDCDLNATLGTAIIFTPYEHSQSDTAFQFSSSGSGNSGIIQKVTNETVDLTAPEVNITELKFIVNGSDPTDDIQPSIYITMKGVVTVGGESTNFALQTLASQRNAE